MHHNNSVTKNKQGMKKVLFAIKQKNLEFSVLGVILLIAMAFYSKLPIVGLLAMFASLYTFSKLEYPTNQKK